jgi:signal transduction histidine kinase
MTPIEDESCTPPDSSSLDDSRLAARERWLDSLISRYAGYMGLVIGVAGSPFILEATPAYWQTTAVLTFFNLALVGFFVTRQPPLAADPRIGPFVVVAYLVLMGFQVYLSPLYGFSALAGYVFSATYLRGCSRWVGIVAAGIMAAYAQTGGSLNEFTVAVALLWAGLSVINAGPAVAFIYFGELSDVQLQRRKAMITQLNQTNRKLSETLDENAALQARLLASAREAGVVDERARLAREIHDTIAQGLTGVIAQLEAADAADDDAPVRRRHTDTAMALARESLTEARRSVQALSPGQLDRAQLPDAVAEMAKRWAETAGVAVLLDTTGDARPLLPEVEVVLFRVAQEALANVGKHAEAERVGLTLSYMDDVVVLDVRDDGRGFDPSTVVTTGDSGYGLAAMEQRVRRVAGALTVESAPGEGTALSASVPAIPAEVTA